MAAQAVHTIHEARIVHSDLKPANFLVVEGQLKLIDFGIAKAISSDTTSIAREAQARPLCGACAVACHGKASWSSSRQGAVNDCVAIQAQSHAVPPAWS